VELRQLKTLVAIADFGSFVGAADAVSLTQSAVSLQISNLEQELGCPLFDRRTRPPVLNEKGLALVEQARKVAELCDYISTIADGRDLAGTITLGAVPTSLLGLLPIALSKIREQYPKLRIRLISGLSAELAGRTRTGEIDAALVTEPAILTDGLSCHTIAVEPLGLIVPIDLEEENARNILKEQPYIQFNKNAWAGQQILQHLLDLGIKTPMTMEIDSLEAIYRLVAQGLGVSIIPLNGATESMLSGVKTIILKDPPLYRTLVVVERTTNPRAALVAGIVDILRKSGEGGHIDDTIPSNARPVL